MSLSVTETADVPFAAPVRARPMVRDRTVILPESGNDAVPGLEGESIRLRLVGNPEGPRVFVLGGISAGRQVASEDDGWWACLAGPGRVIDTDRCLVIGADFPAGRPGCALTPEAVARAFAFALEETGTPRIAALVGSSFGGMVGLSFARLYPERVGQLALLCAAHRPSPMATAIRHVQRQILELTEGTNREADGVSLARQLAMTTYRCRQEFDGRFGRRGGECLTSYLSARGRDYARKTSAARYKALSAAIDRHDEDPAGVRVPTLVIASSTDSLVPPELASECAAELPKLSGFEVIHSLYGHDAFLKEPARIGALLRRVLP
jgi:homoserine O-acetyltransferase